VCLVLAIFGIVSADIPAKINYQVRLADVATGRRLAGSHDLTFRIYDASTGGTELWSESQMLTADSAGVVSAMLGTLNPIEIVFAGPTWLEVEVDEEVLSPRREIVSVPYAFRALHADSLAGLSAEDLVVAGEAGSVTVEMIVGGTGSGLDADMVGGLDADAFSDTGHVHDDRYFTVLDQQCRSLDRAEYQAILDELLDTDVVRYRLKQDENGTEHLGVIAEEVPQAMRSSNGKAVSLGDYSAHLLAAIKAQHERIEALETQVELLRAQVATQ
jgi:hypothetical protein